MNSRSDAHAAVLASMSDGQKAKVDAALMANLSTLAQSDVFRAMQADVSNSGKDAFRSTRSLDADELAPGPPTWVGMFGKLSGPDGELAVGILEPDL